MLYDSADLISSVAGMTEACHGFLGRQAQTLTSLESVMESVSCCLRNLSNISGKEVLLGHLTLKFITVVSCS